MIENQRKFETSNKLWELLELAVADLQQAAKAKNIVVRMNDWHAPKSNGTCVVCLAGAVMRETFLAADFDDVVPSDFDMQIAARLALLEDLRSGNIFQAWITLGNDESAFPSDALQCFPVESFKDDRYQWQADIEKLLDYLKSIDI